MLAANCSLRLNNVLIIFEVIVVQGTPQSEEMEIIPSLKTPEN